MHVRNLIDNIIDKALAIQDDLVRYKYENLHEFTMRFK